MQRKLTSYDWATIVFQTSHLPRTVLTSWLSDWATSASPLCLCIAANVTLTADPCGLGVMDAEFWFVQIRHSQWGLAASGGLSWSKETFFLSKIYCLKKIKKTNIQTEQTCFRGWHTGSEDDHRHSDERADHHDHQQRDGNAFPVSLWGADVHILLQTY